MRALATPRTVIVAAAIVLAAVTAVPAPFAIAQDQGKGLTLRGDPARHAEERETLFARLAKATSEQDARSVADAIWRLWFQAPDRKAGELMQAAMERRGAYDFAAAEAILDELVAIAPRWAEAWNQRATVRFLREDFDASLSDVEEVLRLEPKHFGALAGQALILMRFGRVEAAQSALRTAVEIHPFLPERRLLVQQEDGKDI